MQFLEVIIEVKTDELMQLSDAKPPDFSPFNFLVCIARKLDEVSLVIDGGILKSKLEVLTQSCLPGPFILCDYFAYPDFGIIFRF